MSDRYAPFWSVTFLRREGQTGRVQLALFALCVMLAALSVAVVSGWRASVDDAMASENKKSSGGDVVAFSTEPFTDALLEAARPFQGIRSTEMFTVALAPKTDITLFSKLKAVEKGYPLYGELPLRSGRDPYTALQSGLIVEARVLERLGVNIGDELKIGTKTFPIADVALSEPDRPLGMFGVSPRIFIAHDQLESTGLLRPGSYLERRIHIKLDDPKQAESVAETLSAAAIPDQERVETWEHPPVNMERFVNNFFTFLDMMAVLAVALGGLGMQSTLTTWLANRQKTVALAKTLGADSAFVLRHYGSMVGGIALIGIALGLLEAGSLLYWSGDVLSSMLPVKVAPRLTFWAGIESTALCLLVAGGFSYWPLRQASTVRPASILRSENAPIPRRTVLKQGSLAAVSLFVLLLALVESPSRAGWITLGLTLILSVTGVVTTWTVRRAREWRPKNLALRTALGTWRDPSNKTSTVIFVLSTCLTVLFSTGIVEKALRENWVQAMPPDAPNLIFIDIQPSQREAFEKFVSLPMELIASLRVRAQAVDGKAIDRSKKREYWDRDARRELDASPTLELPSNDDLVDGDSLFQGDDPNQVSIRDDVAKALKVQPGQEVSFSIQGVPVTAKVSSIRHSNREGFRPRFELLFPPALVEGAPQKLFARLKIDEELIGPLQTRVAKEFPSIVSMDISQTIRLVAERLFQMVGIVRYFLLAGLLAGVVILVSAAWSARWDRLRESAYFKILGADRRFVFRVVLYENLALGFLCSALAVILSILIGWSLCTWQLEIPFPDLSGALPGMLFAPTVLISGLGWTLSREVVGSKPAPFLREGAD